MGDLALLAATGRAEWSRIWSVRSSWVLTMVTAVAVLGLAALIGIDVAGDPGGVPSDATAWDGSRPTAMFALFGVLALATVTATADHGNGGIVPTLQWTPRRGVLLLARTLVLVLTATLVGLALLLAATVLLWALVPGVGLPPGEGLRELGGLALVLGCGALLAVGLGLALRSTAGALVSVIALVLVLPPLLANLPYDWALDLSAATPGSSALYLVFGEGPSDDMTTTSARLTLLAWAAGALLLGGRRLTRSDADR
jgi:hypothetical protein